MSSFARAASAYGVVVASDMYTTIMDLGRLAAARGYTKVPSITSRVWHGARSCHMVVRLSMYRLFPPLSTEP